jgi:AbrB family looped-hinge helix DNA binding protein
MALPLANHLSAVIQIFLMHFLLDKPLYAAYNQSMLIRLNIHTYQNNYRRQQIIMADKKTSCCETAVGAGSACRVESLISVDERGQMVLPKELRDKANICAGDKLALVSWEKDGEICCLSLVKADYLAERVKEFLGPVMMGVVSR